MSTETVALNHRVLLNTVAMSEEQMTERKMVSMTKSMAEDIEDLRHAKRLRSESELIREALAIGLRQIRRDFESRSK
jgi:hypothetical protein